MLFHKNFKVNIFTKTIKKIHDKIVNKMSQKIN